MEHDPIVQRKTISEEPDEIRAGFISKVYGILSVQLVLTACVATPFIFNESVRQFAAANQGFLIFVSLLNIVFLCFMVCPCGCQNNMRTYPTNYLLLGGFTITEGMLVGVICSMYTLPSLLACVFATGVLVVGLTLYAVTTKTDFTTLGGYLFAALLVLMIFGVFTMFLPFPFMETVYCCLGILVFSFYLIFDTQMIMGNGELKIGIDDYVFAALQLYIDIIQLFIMMLRLFGERR